jgi:hypothetical protein
MEVQPTSLLKLRFANPITCEVATEHPAQASHEEWNVLTFLLRLVEVFGVDVLITPVCQRNGNALLAGY